MASGHTDYTFRQTGPDVLQREQQNTVKLEVWRDGALVEPAAGGTLTLIDPGGVKLVDAQTVTISAKVPEYTIASSVLPSTVDVGRLFMLRWELTISGQVFVVQRACSVARFPMVLPVTDSDLIDGEYPDLLDQIGDYGSNLQTFLDSAKRDVLRELEQAGQWPDLITSPSDLYEPIRQLAFAKVFRFLFNTNDSDRSQILFQLHQDRYERVMKELTARFDRDDDGLPDSENREAVMRSYHPGGAPRRYARRDPRW